MASNLEIPDDLNAELKTEAAVSHDGDAVALIRSAVAQWTRLRTSEHVLDGHPARPGEAPPAHLTRVLTELDWVSADTLQRMAAAVTEAAGGVAAGRIGAAADYLGPFLNWIAADQTNHALSCRVVMLQAATGAAGQQPSAGIASVADGYLTGNGTTVKGSLRQLFSDRSDAHGAPFAVDRKDSLGVEITLSPEQNGYCAIVLVAESWGGGRQMLRDPEERGGVLAALGQGVNVPNGLFLISLGTTSIPG